MISSGIVGKGNPLPGSETGPRLMPEMNCPRRYTAKDLTDQETILGMLLQQEQQGREPRTGSACDSVSGHMVMRLVSGFSLAFLTQGPSDGTCVSQPR